MTEFEAIAEIQQSRSQFQLENFVVGQHDTAEMRFYQICIELQDMEYKLALATLSLKKQRIKIARLRSSVDELDSVKAEILELQAHQTELAMIGAEREVQCLRNMFNESPKFTRSQIEQAQPEYWRARLLRQSELQVLQSKTGIGWAQLDAHRQMGELRQAMDAIFVPDVPELEAN